MIGLSEENGVLARRLANAQTTSIDALSRARWKRMPNPPVSPRSRAFPVTNLPKHRLGVAHASRGW
jgi:hypothetical protein